ncbi:MAG: PAS domain-containing protein, partial [Lentisphaerota bacterium]
MRADVIGKTPRILNSGTHDPSFFATLWRTVLSGQVYRAEFINRKKNGELYYQSETITSIKDGQDHVSHFVSTGRDVSSSKQAEEELRKSREMLQLVIDTIPQFVFWKNTASVFMGCNRNFARSAGVERPADIIGKTDYDMAWSREEADSYCSWDKKVMTENKPFFHIIESQRQADGKMAWLDTNKIPLHDAEGRVVGILGTYEDITDRIKSEENVKRLAAFPQRNPNPVVEFHEDGSISYSNQATQALATALGQEDVRAILPSDAETLIRECLSSGKPLKGIEAKVNGRTLSWAFIPIKGSHVVHGYGGDITDRLNMEMQLRQLQKMDAIGRLAGGVAHDFNNILTAILGYTSVLLMDKALKTDVVEQLQEIAKSADRAAGLTRQLLTFSRRQIIQARLLNLNDVLNNMTLMLKRIIGEHIALNFQYQPNLPTVFADEVMLEQVILNLAVNARDAMPQGGELTLATTLVEIDQAYTRMNPEAKTGRHVCLIVTDTGCGMDELTRASIFEPFFTTKEEGKGTGLGLATVYGIVKQHEGWIEAHSTVGKGSLFHVYLPARREPVLSIAHGAIPDKVKGGMETILVVEDEDAVRQLILNTLKRYGYQVLEACSGVEALRVWEKSDRRIDMLLTDLVMPGGVNGKDLAEQLIAKQKDLRVLFTSGYNLDALGGTFILS